MRLLANWARFGLVLAAMPPTLSSQEPLVVARGDSVLVHLVGVELRVAVQMLAAYLDRPLVFGALGGQPINLTTPSPIPRHQVLGLLRSALEVQAHDLVDDTVSGVWRVRSRATPAPERGPSPSRTAGAPELFVLRLAHARASDVAGTLNALYGRPGAIGERGGPPAEILGEQLRQNLAPTGAATTQSAAGAAGRVAALQGEVSIVPDPGTNSLLIRASRGDFDLLAAAVQEVDVRPMQVLIEVTIAELRRDRSWSFGEIGRAHV